MALRTSGSIGFLEPGVMGAGKGFENAQWLAYFAPDAIHSLSSLASAAVTLCPVSGGGINVDGDVELMRCSRPLVIGLPGVIANPPDFNFRTAPSRVSRRRPAWRFASSAPWQLKQFLARIGRMSRA